MKRLFSPLLSLYLFFSHPLQAKDRINFSMVISGGVSLGAYESGYNWAMIKMLSEIRRKGLYVEPELRAVAGASAGSINALLSTIYWCQKDDIPLHNTIHDNLFYETWVNLGIEDLAIKGEDPQNKSSLFTRHGLEKKADKIMEHFKKPIYRKGCEVALGVSVTKATPIVEEISGIKIKNQHFSVPLTIREKGGHLSIENRTMGPSTDYFISIPDIEKDPDKIVDVLFASSAFPGAFQQVKLDYIYKGKRRKHYFIDGGAYANIPLQLAIELDKRANLFLFMDPSNMRKEPECKEEEEEELPIGFLHTNTLPLLTSLEIFQSMRLYEAINKYFRNDPHNTLILSSRYHPLAGKYLEHFASFLDRNFRLYDYHVGIYDAIYHLAKKLRSKKAYSRYSQIEVMDRLKTKLGIDESPEALAAYRLFINTEFHHLKPETTDRYSAIYNAFNLETVDTKRYTIEEFKHFLRKLDLAYLPTPKKSFLRYAKKDPDNWYRRPLRMVVNRITTLENDRAKVYRDYASIATMASMGAWAGSTFIKKKDGFEFLPINAPVDANNTFLRTSLRLLPGEIAIDAVNGGASFAYTALYYTNLEYLTGFEGTASYVFSNDSPDFLRLDLDAFYTYEDFLTFGAGASFFGDMEGSFYKRESAYGFNGYVDLFDIFRFTYVRREGDLKNNDYLYIGIENIPSLIYWLSR
jgi:predicted acylesterase/phospholipase RssA